ncbi:MAG: VanZ family protein [Methylovulum sp.]|nr:VanZ family protein [Methylovulum sp.]
MLKIFEVCGLMAYCGFIYWLSDQSKLPTPTWFSWQDKLFHAGAYFILALIVWRSFRHFFKSPIILAIAAVVFSSLYGLSDEWHQAFVPGRNSDVFDWLADTLGAGLAVMVLFKWAGSGLGNRE